MDLLTAIDHLGTLPLAELESWLPEDASAACVIPGVGRGIVVVSFIAGGIDLSDQLDEARTIGQLRQAFDYYVGLWNMNVFSDEDWSDAASNAFQEIEAVALRAAHEMGQRLARNAKFSQAELN